MSVSQGSKDASDSSLVDREELLPSSSGDVTGLQKDSPEQSDGDRSVCGQSSPRSSAPQTGRLPDFWQIRNQSFSISESAKKLVEASWRGSTEKRYAGAWRQWIDWCSLQGVQAATPSLANVLDYLASLFDKGVQYRTINLHRSALSSTLKPIDGFPVGQHPLVCRLLKGAFNMRPPRPNLCPSWSIQVVLDMLKVWSPASSLSLKCLSLKTGMLVALASAKRPASLALLSIKEGFCEIGQSSMHFQPVDLEKSEGLGHCAPPLLLSQFTEDPRLCPVIYLKAYTKRTSSFCLPGCPSWSSGCVRYCKLAEESHLFVWTSWDRWLNKSSKQFSSSYERGFLACCACGW